MRIFLVFILLLVAFSGQSLLSQNKMVEVQGYVTDSVNKETIPYVHVIINGTSIGTTTDSVGYFKLNLKEESILDFHHTAYNVKKIKVDVSKILKVQLTSKNYQTKEVIIKSNTQSLVKEKVPGKLLIKQKDILLTPNIMGEADLVRALQLMPGIQSVNEGNSGIYVRGGSPGHNYIELDEMELLNPSHLMGIYSVFNPLSVEKVDFYKGNAPVHKGARLSSSIIVNSKSKPDGDYKVAANLGNLSSNIYLQGSLKNKINYNIGFRRSYLELIQKAAGLFLADEDNYFVNNKFTFYDFNGKITYPYKNGFVALAWYKGNDVFNFSKEAIELNMGNSWGNQAMSLTNNHLLNNNLTLKNSLSYTEYKSDLNIDITTQSLKFKTNYKHYLHKTELLFAKTKHSIRLGVHNQYRIISPNSIDLNLSTNNNESFLKYEYFISKWLVGSDVAMFSNLDVYFGVAVDYYHQIEKQTEGYSIQQTENEVEEKDRFLWTGIASFNYKLPKNNAIKGSVGYLTQNMHLTSIASIPLPSDVWMPATTKVPAETGQQYTLGYFKQINNINTEYGIEGYAKLLNHQQLLKVNVEGEEILDFEDSFFDGKSKAYGIEVSVKKHSENLSTNISYTLGWVKQKFASVNKGRWHEAKYDRRHDLNVMTNYKLSDKVDVGLVFIFATGNKATLPVGRYWMMGQIANDYEGINNFRMPVYHRADLSVNYYLKSNVFKESVINFSVINLLNRSNPYFIYFDVEEGEKSYELNIKAKQVSLFPILPSISWKVKF